MRFVCVWGGGVACKGFGAKGVLKQGKQAPPLPVTIDRCTVVHGKFVFLKCGHN